MKQDWRRRLKKIRENLPSQRRKQAGERACLELYQRSQQAALILSFASFGLEIDLWLLNKKLAAEKRLVLPRSQGNELQLFYVLEIEQLELTAWGLLEPKSSICLPIKPSQIEIAFIPGLGFDLQTKHRLGYGLGYYDRFLHDIPLMTTWGVGFLEQAVQDLPYDAKDVPLKEIYLF